MEPSREIDFGEARALNLIARHQAVVLHAAAAAHQVPHRKAWMGAGDHPADATGAHHCTDFDRRDVALAFIHPAAHGGVQAQAEVLEQHAAFLRGEHRFLGALPAFWAWQALGALGQADLSIDEVIEVHAVARWGKGAMLSLPGALAGQQVALRAQGLEQPLAHGLHAHALAQIRV